MPSTLQEAPVITRGTIIIALERALETSIATAKEGLAKERENWDNPSETDREAQALFRLEVSKAVSQHEMTLAHNTAFLDWLRQQRPDTSDPLGVGNIWVLEQLEERIIWLVYDPDAPLPGSEVYISLYNLEGVQKELGAKEVATLAVDCPLYNALLGKDIRVGADVSIGIEGNEPETMRLTAVV